MLRCRSRIHLDVRILRHVGRHVSRAIAQLVLHRYHLDTLIVLYRIVRRLLLPCHEFVGGQR